MWKRRKVVGARAAAPLEWCDLCGATFPLSGSVTGYVAGSSSPHPACDWFDGLRRVTACGDPNFDVIGERYLHGSGTGQLFWPTARSTRPFLSLPSRG